MICKKALFVLLVAVFTFLGLSALQNLSYFTDIFGDVKITVNISAQEEENETSNNEVKEVKQQMVKNQNDEILNKCNAAHLLAIHHHNVKINSGFLEVSTPPPEFSIV